MIDALKQRLESSLMFQCAACNIAKGKESAHGVLLWRPKNRMLSRMVENRVGTYVICSECAKLPDKETFPRIEATLAKQGLFG
jgi:hypothetical protein